MSEEQLLMSNDGDMGNEMTSANGDQSLEETLFSSEEVIYKSGKGIYHGFILTLLI